jgi:hypothetical protein
MAASSPTHSLSPYKRSPTQIHPLLLCLCPLSLSSLSLLSLSLSQEIVGFELMKNGENLPKILEILSSDKKLKLERNPKT